MTGGVKEIAMAHEVYYEFHQNLEQLRRHGARGGKATSRHRRERERQWCPSKNLPSPGGTSRFRATFFFSVLAARAAAPRTFAE